MRPRDLPTLPGSPRPLYPNSRASDTEALKEDIVFDATLRGFRLVFHSTWGLFSPRRIDRGTSLLTEYVELADGQHTLDLGCGYGAIGLTVARECPNGVVHMVDKDYVAVNFARENAELNAIGNCEIYLSNAFSEVGNTRFDNVVANLPANVGKELLYIMLSGASRHLKRGGQLVVVTISGLRQFIKRNLEEVFGNYEKLKQGRGYTVARALKLDLN